jgi:hypothetical protein
MEKKEHVRFIGFVFLLSLVSLGAVTYIYIHFNEQNLRIHQRLKEQLTFSQYLQKQLDATVVKMDHMPPPLPPPPSLPKHEMTTILWFIREAKWQMNTLYEPLMAIKLLKHAQKIAHNQQYLALDEALSQDLSTISLQTLTPTITIVTAIEKIQHLISAIPSSQPNDYLMEKKKPHGQDKILSLLWPYLRVENYQQSVMKITPPSQQMIVIENIQLLLPQIQIAAVNHQNELYQILFTQFEEQYHSLQNPPMMTEPLEILKNAKIQLEKPVYFQSFSEIHQLLNESIEKVEKIS